MIVEEDGTPGSQRTYDEMARRSDQVAAWLAGWGSVAATR